MTDDERVARGRRAFSEFNELSQAFDDVEAAILKAMVSAPPTQPDKILTLHMAAQNLQALKTALKSYVDDGHMAATAISMAGLTRQTHP